MLEDCGLHTIIRIPPVFKPYADVKTNLLFFQKGVKSKGVWFYRLDMPDGVKNFTKTKPMEDKHFDIVREWWDNRQDIIIDVNYKSKFYSIDELESLDFNFDKCCPFPKEEEEILKPAELITQYQENRLKYNKKIDEILNKITSILEEK